MNTANNYLNSTIPLTLTAHNQATQFCRQGFHGNNKKQAKQIYLNTLAVYAVDYYLQFWGFETDLINSESWNPTIQRLMDVADLTLKNLGKVECRPVLPGAKKMNIPPEVWSERIGYVAVELSHSLQEATLLGFTDANISNPLFPLEQLSSLSQLIEKLYQLQEKSLSKPLTNLSQWFNNMVCDGWQQVETLLNSPQVVWNFRGPQAVLDMGFPQVSRGKLLDVGTATAQQVALLVGLIPNSGSPINSEIDIWLKVCPTNNQIYLPYNLQLIILDETGNAIMKTQARKTEAILLKFSGQKGEQFSLQLVLDDLALQEAFMI